MESTIKAKIAKIYGLGEFPDNPTAILSDRRQEFSKENPANPASQVKYRIIRPYGMVGTGKAHSRCGEWVYMGCPNGPHRVLDGAEPRQYVETKRYRCGRPVCPKCYHAWAYFLGVKSERRYQRYLELVGRRVSKRHHFWLLHVVVSGTKNRQLVYKLLKEAGLKGGIVIEHPWRRPPYQKWRLSHHWHGLGVGWIDGDKVRKIYQKHKIVIAVKKGGQRRDWFATAYYQLTHCAAAGHSMHWFGAMAYNKFASPPIESKKQCCPQCGSKLVPMKYVGPKGFGGLQVGPWKNPKWFVYRTLGKPPPGA